MIIDHNSNCCFSVAVILSSSCLSCSQLSHRHLCCVLSSCIPPQTPYPKCSHFPLLIPFELHALTCLLQAPGFWCISASSSPLPPVSGLFAQPALKHSVCCSISSFKLHKFLDAFLLWCSTAPTQWFISSAPRFERRLSLIPSSHIWCHKTFWQYVKSWVHTDWRVFQITQTNFNRERPMP